jgi:hypothetical protein
MNASLCSEGFAGLYTGLSASLIRQAVFIGVKFGSYDYLKTVASDENGSLSFVGKAACGMGAGAFGAMIGNPADMAMVRMQVRRATEVQL